VRMYELMQPIREVKNDINDAAEDTLDEMEDRSHVIDQLTNLQARFGQLAKLISNVLRGYVKKVLLDNADPFGLYISPLQTCGNVKSPPGIGNWQKDHKLWWWFDHLHSRRTGDFAEELLDIATGEKPGADGETEDRPLLKSYSIGYLSHLAADVVGHAYVNSITGGPYRLNQSQRHTAQEKIMDVWAYNHFYEDGGAYTRNFSLKDLNDTNDDRYYHSDELVDSGMHKNFQFTQGDIEPRQWTPDPDHTFGQGNNPPIRSALKLPDEIAGNFATAAGRAYDSDIYGELTAAEVASSYRSWYKMFQNSTSTFSPVPPDELPGDVDLTGPLKEELQELSDEASDVTSSSQSLWDAITSSGSPNLGAAAQCMANVASGDFDQDDVNCLEEAAEAINSYIAGVASAVADLFKGVMDLFVQIFEIVEAIAAIPLVALNFLLQKAYEGVWACYKRLLMLVSAIGFGTMYSEDLNNPQLQNLWNPTLTDGAQRRARDWIVMPRLRESGFPRRGLKAGHTVNPEEEERLQGLENDAHLLVPFGDIEKPRTIPGPDEYGQYTPEVFIDDPGDVLGGDSSWGSSLYDHLPDPITNASSPSKYFDKTDFRAPAFSEDPSNWGDDQAFKNPELGDALTLTVALFKRYKKNESDTGEDNDIGIPNLNMSGDRAIGFPTWANANGCELKSRKRWETWHDWRVGGGVPWLREEIDPVFNPDEELHY